jgi:hypothetical protein
MNWVRAYLDRENKKRIKGLSSSLLEDYILSLVKERIAVLAPDEALRFLFDLDTRLYPLQGQEATRLGNGIHPKHRLMKYHDFFVNRVQREERVLDIGCGIGEYR